MKHYFVTGTIDDIDGGSSGVPFVIVNLANELNKSGHDIAIINAYRGDAKSMFNLDPSINSYYATSINLTRDSKFVRIAKIFIWILAIFKFIRHIKHKSPSIVISVAPPATILLLLVNSFIPNMKIIVWENIKFNVYNLLMNRIRLHLFSRAAIVIRPTTADLQLFLNRNINACCIYNFIQHIDVKPRACGATKLLAAGRFVEQKGFDLLLDSLFHLKYNLNTEFTCTIVGDGPLRNELENKIFRLKLENSVCIEKFTPILSTKYTTHDIFLLPSRYEGLPIVLLESQMYGLPCVAFDCPTGPAEVIYDKINGELVGCYDTDAYAISILNFIKNPEYYKASSYNAIQYSNRFSKNDILFRWKNVLQSLT